MGLIAGKTLDKRQLEESPFHLRMIPACGGPGCGNGCGGFVWLNLRAELVSARYFAYFCLHGE